MHEEFVGDLKAIQPKLFTKNCPFKTGLYYTLNYTGEDEINLQRRRTVTHQILPNGVYKINLKFFNKNDPLIYEIEWVYFIRKRLGEEDF